MKLGVGSFAGRLLRQDFQYVLMDEEEDGLEVAGIEGENEDDSHMDWIKGGGPSNCADSDKSLAPFQGVLSSPMFDTASSGSTGSVSCGSLECNGVKKFRFADQDGQQLVVIYTIPNDCLENNPNWKPRKKKVAYARVEL